MSDLLYFAYGSNMNAARMHERVGWEAPRFAVYLPDYELRFNKEIPSYGWCAANIVPAPGKQVEGIAYEVQERELAILDGYEKVAEGHYERQPMTVFRVADDTPCAVIGYVALQTGPDKPPTREYLNHLLAGAPLLSEGYVANLQKVRTLE